MSQADHNWKKLIQYVPLESTLEMHMQVVTSAFASAYKRWPITTLCKLMEYVVAMQQTNFIQQDKIKWYIASSP